jgi:hypothetical protein
VATPAGNRPERSEGIIRFRNFWFVKFRERAIRWIFGGVWPPWAETTRDKNSSGGGADLAAFFVYGSLEDAVLRRTLRRASSAAACLAGDIFSRFISFHFTAGS